MVQPLQNWIRRSNISPRFVLGWQYWTLLTPRWVRLTGSNNWSVSRLFVRLRKPAKLLPSKRFDMQRKRHVG